MQDRSRQSPGLVLCSYLSPHPRPGLKADAPCLLQTSEHVDGLGTTGSVLKPQSHHGRVSEHQTGTAGRAGDRHRGVLLGLPRSARAPHSPARSALNSTILVSNDRAPPNGHGEEALCLPPAP